MKPHTYSTVTLTSVKRDGNFIRVEATYCQNYGRKSDYNVVIKDADKLNLDLRLKGERDLLCIEVEKEIERLRNV